MKVNKKAKQKKVGQLVAVIPPSITIGSSRTFFISGDFSPDGGPFGGTGLENGRFSGSFSIDPSAVDQLDDSQPMGNLLGIYALTGWSVNFFDASNVLVGQFNNTHGGDRGNTDYPGPGDD